MIASEGSFVGNLRVVDNTCKAKKILDTKGTLKGKEVSHADPAKHSAPSKIKNEVFKLTAPYNEMETHILKYNNKKLHLYPTNQVAKIFEESSSKGNKELDKQLKLNFENNTLNINLDTTEYFPKAAAKNKKVKILNNDLFRNNVELHSKKNVFVITENNKLLVTRKNIDTKKGGRIHHSSLVKGKPVKAAGMLFIQNEANGTQRITLNNESGHYKPTPQSLDKIIQWFDNHDLKFKILSDGIEDTYFGKVRTVVLEKQSGQISK